MLLHGVSGGFRFVEDLAPLTFAFTHLLCISCGCFVTSLSFALGCCCSTSALALQALPVGEQQSHASSFQCTEMLHCNSTGKHNDVTMHSKGIHA